MDTLYRFSLCRLCLCKSQKLIDIFEEGGRHGYIAAQAIQDLLQLKVSKSDGYPQHMCPICLDKLTDFKIFKHQCQDSLVTLQSGQWYSSRWSGELKVTPKREKDETEGTELEPDRNHLQVSPKEEADDIEGIKPEPDDLCSQVFRRIKSEEEDTNQDSHCEVASNGTGHLQKAYQTTRVPSGRDAMLGGRCPSTRQSGRRWPPLSCHECGKVFPYRSYLVRHEMQHRGERPYGCEMCDKRFYRSHDLVKHHLSHTGERPFVCVVCNKGFSIKSNMVMHQRTHSQERPFVCPVCGKSFTQNGNLRTHERIHSGEKPYICLVCNKAFTHATNLKAHGIIHSRKQWKGKRNCIVGRAASKGVVCAADIEGSGPEHGKLMDLRTSSSLFSRDVSVK